MTKRNSNQLRTFARRSIAVMIAATLTLSSTSAFAGGIYSLGFENSHSKYKLAKMTNNLTNSDAELVNLLQNKYAHFTELTMKQVKDSVLYYDVDTASALTAYFSEQMLVADGFVKTGSLKEAVNTIDQAIKQVRHSKVKYKGKHRGKSELYPFNNKGKQWTPRDWAKVKADFNNQVTAIKAGLNRLENAETKADILQLVDYTYANILEKFDRMEKIEAQKAAKRQAHEAEKAAKAKALEEARKAAETAKNAEEANQPALEIDQVKALPVAKQKTKNLDVYKPDNNRVSRNRNNNHLADKRHVNEFQQKTGNKHEQKGGKQHGKGSQSGKGGRGQHR